MIAPSPTAVTHQQRLLNPDEVNQGELYFLSKFKTVAGELKRAVLLQHALFQLIAKHSVQIPNLNALLQPSPPQPHTDAFTNYDQVKQRCVIGAKRPTLSIATFNLWNVQGDWPQRKDAILKQIRDEQFDVIGLQEIRIWQEKNQLTDLHENVQSLGYHSWYESVRQPIPSDPKSFEEGIGFLSRHPILRTHSRIISSAGTPPRKVLAADIEVTTNGHPPRLIQVFVTHTTFVDVEQCAQMIRIVKFMNRQLKRRTEGDTQPITGQFLVGDLNMYMDWEYPIDLVTQPLSNRFSSGVSPHNPCVATWKQFFPRLFPSTNSLIEPSSGLTKLLYPLASNSTSPPSFPSFRDLHASIYPDGAHSPGRTFPTYGDERIQDPCRPDRILIRQFQSIKDSTALPTPSPSASSVVPSHPSSSIILSTSSWLECDVGVFLHQPIRTEPSVEYPSDHRGVVGVFHWVDESPSTSLVDQFGVVQAWRRSPRN